MKIYTSYWAQVRNFPPNLVVLNTTIYPPKWYAIGGKDKNGIISLHCPPVRPGHKCDGLCNGKCHPKHPNDCAFLKQYRKQLDEIDFQDFMNHLNKLHDSILSDNPELKDIDFALIVFEKYDNPCSERWPLQDWLRAHGVEVEEWNKTG